MTRRSIHEPKPNVSTKLVLLYRERKPGIKAFHIDHVSREMAQNWRVGVGGGAGGEGVGGGELLSKEVCQTGRRWALT